MLANRLTVGMAFAMIIFVFYLTYTMFVLNPFMSKNFLTADDSIALYIDTLSSVDSGNVMMSFQKGLIKSLCVTFETEGKKDGYEIGRDGWYVLVSYKLADRTIKDASIIESYPEDFEGEMMIPSPDEVCIKKNKNSRYARVGAC